MSNQRLLYAEKLVNKLANGIVSHSKLTEFEINHLALFFYRYNPIFNRIVNLRTKLPLSSITVQKPKTSNDIVQDYIHTFYDNIYTSTNMENAIRKVTLYYNLFSKAYVLVEDDFSINSNVDVVDESDLTNKEFGSISKEDREKIDSIVKAYNNGDIIEDGGIDFVINKYILDINKNYRGLKKIRVISPFNIKVSTVNEEIDYYEYELEKSEHITAYINANPTKSEAEIINDLVEAGYSNAYAKLHYEYKNSSTITVTNDKSEDIYIIEISRGSICEFDDNFFSPIMKDLIKYYSSDLKDQERINRQNKITNIVKVPYETTDEKVAELESKIDEALESEDGSYVTTNLDVSVESVTFELAKTEDAEDIKESSERKVLVGTGTPESLMNASDSYGSSYLKLEILQTEFYNYRKQIQSLVETGIFKPIALKKGFITVDAFGYAKYLFSKVSFEIGSIVNNQDFIDVLRDLAQDEHISMSTVLERYNIDQEEEFKKIKEEKERKENAGIN